MLRWAGYLVGCALIWVAIGQAVARDWTIDGVFLLLAGVGLAMMLAAVLITYENTPDSSFSTRIDETHPDALGSLDLEARSRRKDLDQ